MMKAISTAILSMAAGLWLGTTGFGKLSAQDRPKDQVYTIAEVDITNPDAFAKDYAGRAAALLKASGGRVVASQVPISIEGDAPKSRVIVTLWDSWDQVESWRATAEYKELRVIRDESAKIVRSYRVNAR
jgi:uncharacterized protein (DUF1330 family)